MLNVMNKLADARGRRRCSQPNLSCFGLIATSAVGIFTRSEIVAKRSMNKKQQIRWRSTVQPFLEVPAAVLNDRFEGPVFSSVPASVS
jgi:hypothetical protein